MPRSARARAHQRLCATTPVSRRAERRHHESSKTERKERKGEKEKRGEEGREAERRLLVAGGWPVFQRELAGAAGRRRSSGGAEQDGEEKAEGEKRRAEQERGEGSGIWGFLLGHPLEGQGMGAVAFVTVRYLNGEMGIRFASRCWSQSYATFFYIFFVIIVVQAMCNLVIVWP